MIKSAELAGPSCLTRATDDEPLFVLRANDELAPDVVRKWAADYYAQKKMAAGRGGYLTDAQHRKYSEALNIAWEMERWKEVRDAHAATRVHCTCNAQQFYGVHDRNCPARIPEVT